MFVQIRWIFVIDLPAYWHTILLHKNTFKIPEIAKGMSLLFLFNMLSGFVCVNVVAIMTVHVTVVKRTLFLFTRERTLRKASTDERLADGVYGFLPMHFNAWALRSVISGWGKTAFFRNSRWSWYQTAVITPYNLIHCHVEGGGFSACFSR